MTTQEEKAKNKVESILQDIFKNSPGKEKVLKELCASYAAYDNRLTQLVKKSERNGNGRGASWLTSDIDKAFYIGEVCRLLKQKIIYYTMVCGGYEMNVDGGWKYNG